MNPTPDLQTKILLAEDDNDMRKFLVRALQNAGYDVASFDNGLSAYNRLREEPFDRDAGNGRYRAGAARNRA